jgi:hypothetical protein
VQSSLDAVVRGGTAYLIEVTSAQLGGGTLQFSLDFDPAASCDGTPRAGCRTPVATGGSSLKLKQGLDPSQRQLVWKWAPGATTLLTDFGAPTTTVGTSYVVCIYDASSSLVGSARAPAGDGCGSGLRDCWRQSGTKFTYKDRERLPDGLKTLTLKAGIAGRAKIIAKGAGATLGVPPLPAAFPLVVQLVNSHGFCWEASYPASGIQRNDAFQLKAKGG